ncbi:Isochorismatase-like protein [Astrocystis sublimbata]|nr:Isochorismatase-like protein [Astrocystis sublimbata]
MTASHHIEIIGGKNFWLYSSDSGYDLTHPPTPSSTPVYPRIPLRTTSSAVTIDPSKSALVVIDLQNYFLSPALGRPSESVGLQVTSRLLKHAIPACRVRCRHQLLDVAEKDDIHVYKNRLSGFWGETGIEDVLTARGIKTLLFAGCNTDQCVGGTVQGAYTKGWDCLLLSDGTATSSPAFAQHWLRGVEKMQTALE